VCHRVVGSEKVASHYLVTQVVEVLFTPYPAVRRNSRVQRQWSSCFLGLDPVWSRARSASSG
jgi:hypothetical protein